MSSQRLILGFDFGTRRIGVAVGNELTRSARHWIHYRRVMAFPTGRRSPGWSTSGGRIFSWLACR